MIEHSVFESNQEISIWLEKNYFIKCINIHHCDFGSANCYYIETASQIYFMKEFQSKIKIENLLNEINVCAYLDSRGFKTSKYVKNLCGDYITEFKERFIHIQQYIEGTTYKLFAVPDKVLFASAKKLAQINNLLINYNVENVSFQDEWLVQWDNDKEIKKLIELRNLNVIGDFFYTQINTDLNFKIAILKSMKNYSKKFIGSFRCNSHGDYSILQLLCKNEEIEAVIDFSSVNCLPVTWEIIRSYSYAANECKNGDDLDYYKFKKYTDSYLEEKSIPLKDVVLMPYLYFFNLSRSTFGYNQYLKELSSNEELIKFAFWRTNMCRWLHKNMDRLSKFLQEQYVGILY